MKLAALCKGGFAMERSALDFARIAAKYTEMQSTLQQCKSFLICCYFSMASRGAATTVSPAASAAEVARVLVASRCKAAGVTDVAGKLVGLVSVRDIIKRVVYPGKSVNDVACREFMTPAPSAVTEAEAADVEKVLTTMAQRGFRHMPVVDSSETMIFTRMLDVLSVTQQVLSPKSGSVVQVCSRPLRDAARQSRSCLCAPRRE